MAKMVPEHPRDFCAGSLEDIMFSSLEKLPDEYYVIHSFRLVSVKDGIIHESETDFVVFSPNKGILCLEAKAGHVQYSNGEWMYGSGIRMSHDGPYNQASKNKWNIKDLFINNSYSSLLNKCKLLHAVWFPSISREEFSSKVLPPEADKRITLLKDDLANPLDKIESIFSIDVPNGVQTQLDSFECNTVVRKLLCPSFDLVPSISFENDLKKQVFHHMLSEQKCVLNFLSEQRSAVIQGVAGTGKTLIALEKARRHADAGDKVLFLCFNRFLHQHIASTNSNPNIDYYTIDGFACKFCGTSVANYTLLKQRLEDTYLEQSFPYKHVIIDEGQDFGQDNIEENEILKILETIILDSKDSSSFYVFYDPMQLVQGSKVPVYISNADCKLTLYKNCRNTENIAITSMKPISNKPAKLIDGCIKGTVPKLYFCDSDEEQYKHITKIIAKYRELGIKDIVVLTCKTESTSSIASYVNNGKILNKYLFTTCRKFKGLEADAIIVIDVDKKTLTSDAAKVFYVGASRARLYLSIICSLDDNQCRDVLDEYHVSIRPRNIKKQLSTVINTMYVND